MDIIFMILQGYQTLNIVSRFKSEQIRHSSNVIVVGLPIVSLSMFKWFAEF